MTKDELTEKFVEEVLTTIEGWSLGYEFSHREEEGRRVGFEVSGEGRRTLEEAVRVGLLGPARKELPWPENPQDAGPAGPKE